MCPISTLVSKYDENKLLFCNIWINVVWHEDTCGFWWWQGHRYCDYYCGLLPTFINAEFQIEVIETKDVTFHPNFWIPWILSTGPLKSYQPQVKNPVLECWSYSLLCLRSSTSKRETEKSRASDLVFVELKCSSLLTLHWLEPSLWPHLASRETGLRGLKSGGHAPS